MIPARYIVLEHDGQWKLNINNRYFGPFDTREDGVREAIHAAEKAGKLGYDAQVMVMNGTTSFETVWHYGKDPLPD